MKSRIAILVAAALTLTSCTHTVYGISKPDKNGGKEEETKREVPDDLSKAELFPLQASDDPNEVYRNLQWRCLTAEYETSHKISRSTATRGTLIVVAGLAILSATTFTAVPNDWGGPQAERNRTWLSVGLGALGTSIGTYVAGLHLDDRIDGNREQLQRIRQARDRAKALWITPRITDAKTIGEERKKALLEMATACNQVAYFERTLGQPRPSQEQTPAPPTTLVGAQVKEYEERLEAEVERLAQAIAAKDLGEAKAAEGAIRLIKTALRAIDDAELETQIKAIEISEGLEKNLAPLGKRTAPPEKREDAEETPPKKEEAPPKKEEAKPKAPPSVPPG